MTSALSARPRVGECSGDLLPGTSTTSSALGRGTANPPKALVSREHVPIVRRAQGTSRGADCCSPPIEKGMSGWVGDTWGTALRDHDRRRSRDSTSAHAQRFRTAAAVYRFAVSASGNWQELPHVGVSARRKHESRCHAKPVRLAARGLESGPQHVHVQRSGHVVREVEVIGRRNGGQ